MTETNSELERVRVESDIAIRREELELRRQELDAQRRSRVSPLAATIAAGIVGLIGTTLGALSQGLMTQRLEEQKFESELVLQALKSSDNGERHKNLEFLSTAGLLKVLGPGIERASRDSSSILPTFAGADPLGAGIRSVYQEVLNRTPDAWEIEVWRTKITGGSSTLASMRKEFVADPQCRAAIVQVYSGIIGRTPGDEEIGSWQGALLAGKSLASIRADSARTHGGR